jgi:hypothetical protein
MIGPVPVDTRISRRHRHGFWKANCCASAPPHDNPRTSTCKLPGSPANTPTLLQKMPSTRARYGKRYGNGESGEAPEPGTSNRTTVVCGLISVTTGSSTSRLAPTPLHNTSGIPVPHRILTLTCWPSMEIRPPSSFTRAPSAAVTGKLYHIGEILAAHRRLMGARSLSTRISRGRPFGTCRSDAVDSDKPILRYGEPGPYWQPEHYRDGPTQQTHQYQRSCT